MENHTPLPHPTPTQTPTKAPKKTKVQIGQHIENLSVVFLKKQRLTILDRNFHSRFGEIDIIAFDHNILVFIEVRYRQHIIGDNIVASIGRQKQRKIKLTAQYYLQKKRISIEKFCRFDVLAIHGDQDHPHINWIKNAF